MRAKASTSPHPRGPDEVADRARLERERRAAQKRHGFAAAAIGQGDMLNAEKAHGAMVAPFRLQGARRLPAGKQASARTGMPQRGGRVKPSEAPSDGPAARRAHPRSRRIRVRCRNHRPPSRARKAGTCTPIPAPPAKKEPVWQSSRQLPKKTTWSFSRRPFERRLETLPRIAKPALFWQEGRFRVTKRDKNIGLCGNDHRRAPA